MEAPPWDEHALERMRRSVAMLTPRHPAALDREAALELLSELTRLRRQNRQFNALLREVRVLLDAADNAGRTL